MGKVTGFLEFKRKTESYDEVEQRVKNFKEFTHPLGDEQLQQQAARCMNCGVPFCHSGCPLGNLIPDFNEAVYQGHWEKASTLLHHTNNFPEFTGRLCPAPCEEACVLNINNDPVSIENIEKSIAEKAFVNGWLTTDYEINRSGKAVAIVGSGPSGLAAAEQLNRAGHMVTVFEKDAKAGGLLRYGIPDFKLEKSIIDRRLALMTQAGVVFKTNCEIGLHVSVDTLKRDFDALVVCTGANAKRELNVSGSQLAGVVQAMNFLSQNNKKVSGESFTDEPVTAKNKHVIVIGGGDTGSDCIGTSIRQGAKSVVNFEIMPKPPVDRPVHQPWPHWPMKLRSSTSHQEGVTQYWSLATKSFDMNAKGQLCSLTTVAVKWQNDQGQMKLIELPNTEKQWPCDLALLALGFTGSETTLADHLGIQLDARTNFPATSENFKLSDAGVFAGGDCRRGQSLIVWAISEGRELAYHVDKYLMGQSQLPLKGPGDLPSP